MSQAHVFPFFSKRIITFNFAWYIQAFDNAVEDIKTFGDATVDGGDENEHNMMREASKFVLLPDENHHDWKSDYHNVRVVDEEEILENRGTLEDRSVLLSKNNLPVNPRMFGRETEQCELLQFLHNQL